MPTYPGKTKNRFVYVANDDEKPLWIDIDGTLRNRWLPGFLMPREATLHDRTVQGGFKKLWNSLGGNETNNPLVWVISFRLLDESR